MFTAVAVSPDRHKKSAPMKKPLRLRDATACGIACGGVGCCEFVRGGVALCLVATVCGEPDPARGVILRFVTTVSREPDLGGGVALWVVATASARPEFGGVAASLRTSKLLRPPAELIARNRMEPRVTIIEL